MHQELSQRLLVKHIHLILGYHLHRYPLRDSDQSTSYQNSILPKIESKLSSRPFRIGWGDDNSNVWDFMVAVCQHSYLLSYAFIPQGQDHTTVNSDNWDTLGIPFDDYTQSVITDAIDSIARVWFRIWQRYLTWEN